MFSTLLFSCKKNVNEIDTLSSNQNNQSLKEVNLKVASTVLKIAKEESEFKRQVFEECHKQKFGDYNVKIVDLLSNTIVNNLLKLEDRLILNELQTKSKALSGNDLIIFVPSIERFYNRKINTGLRTSNQEETIGVITDEFNNPTQTAPGYIVDNNGSLTFYQTIDESFAWENDIWVFGQEENCSPENMVANPDDTDVLTYGRTNGQTENGGVIKVTDWSLVEPWVLGKPEFRQVVYKGSATPTNAIFDKKYGKWRRQNFNGQFKNFGSFLFNWNQSNIGDWTTEKWIEEDGGTFFTLTFGVTYKINANLSATANVSIPIKNNDDDLGVSLVQFNDAENQIYNQSGIEIKRKP